MSDRRRSAEAKARGRLAALALNRQRPLLPRCGATCRTTGEPCRDVAMANGRCYRHGGRTPSGRDWHRFQPPDPNSPRAEEKLARKLNDHAKTAKKRERRVAALTPKKRSDYRLWTRTHKPGSKEQRDAAQERSRQAVSANALVKRLFADDPPPSPERVALDAAIAELEAELARRAERKSIIGDVFG